MADKLPVIICDDSGFARKAIARSLPDGWAIDIHFASNGEEALALIESGKGDLMFLDLNMPVMDGYETMRQIKARDLPIMTIVVSGDVQEKARETMLSLGAIDFIRKPIDNAKLWEILDKYGIYQGEKTAQNRVSEVEASSVIDDDAKLDAIREAANVAMGRAGESLATLIDSFIALPIPKVSVIDVSDLHMTLSDIDNHDNVSAVSKGFISVGVKGEAIIVFSDAKTQNLRTLLGATTKEGEDASLEVLMDVANIIIGACFDGLAEQLEGRFTHTSPIILGLHSSLNDVLKSGSTAFDKTLVIEIAYAIAKHDIHFELLILMPGNDIDIIYNRLVAHSEKHA